MRLDGKVALITGSGSGIGEACATLFAEEGAKIASADIDQDSAVRAAGLVSTAGGEAIALGGDVTSKSECERMVKETVDRFGSCDILINSAGITPRYVPADTPFDEKWDRVIDVNLKGTMLMSYYAVQQMKKQASGAIVNLASIIGLVGYTHGMGLSDGFNPYPHSKGGVVQMTRDMGVALAQQGIRVNALCPGFAHTALTKSLTEDPVALARLEGLHPMGRLGQAIEIAQAALFLSSDEASFITGACLPVDGGYTAQ